MRSVRIGILSDLRDWSWAGCEELWVALAVSALEEGHQADVFLNGGPVQKDVRLMSLFQGRNGKSDPQFFTSCPTPIPQIRENSNSHTSHNIIDIGLKKSPRALCCGIDGKTWTLASELLSTPDNVFTTA